MVELDSDADHLIHVSLDAFDLRGDPLPTVTPSGSAILLHRFEWLMLKQAHRVFTYDAFQLTRHSQFGRVSSQYRGVATISSDGINIDVIVYAGVYAGVPSITVSGAPVTGAPVPVGLSIRPLLVRRYYAGVEADCRVQRSGPWRAVDINCTRRFDATVLWEYDFALARTASTEAQQNRRVSVWRGAVINLLRLR